MEPVAVRVRECPDHPDGDVVYMAPTLSLAGGLEAEYDNSVALAETIAAAGPRPPEGYSEATQELLALDMARRLRVRWLVTYVRFGVVGWTLHDESGPMPLDIDAILADYNLAAPVAEKGDELYGETVARPLLARQAARLQPGPMDRLTSAKRRSTTKPRKRSSPATTAASEQLSA